jgi:CheY-like chemotaxis protein
MTGNGKRPPTRGAPISAWLGTSVRSRRIRLGLSQEQLAERAGLHRTYIAGIEGGGRNITLKSIEKLALALETSVSTLLAESDRSARTSVPSLLVAEDNPKDLEATLAGFRRARLTNEIHIVRDGEAALDFLFCKGKYAGRRGTSAPQIVLLDMSLPKVNGLEVLRRIKADDRTRPIHVIAMADSDGESREALKLGAADYLVKPVDFQKFCGVTPQLSFDWTLLQPSAV